MSNPAIPLLVILGPTASGKTRLAVAAAQALGGEIISADSRQVYRGMDLGTGKDLAEYGAVPYHLIDIADPGEEYSLFRFQKECFAAITRITDRGRLPILCGGSGLYLDAVLRGYRLVEVPENPALRAELAGASDAELAAQLRQLRPQLHNTTDLGDRQRLLRAIEIATGERALAARLPPLPQLRPRVFGLRWERSRLRQRIAFRLRERLEQGLLEEVTRLHAAGIPWERLEFFGLEYRFVAWHLQGRLNRNDMTQQLASAIGAFAKRQETFFRRMERQGVAIHWLAGQGEPVAEMLAELARQKAGPLPS
ncbi:tRNA delta(2)-isopentenylpyrophosphate transferase [Desulfuromonas sp. DDH964]|uniref:tRNA (adenosine(37)-N6)-dimethylallyltransferase MiaA n=1 Tax=Desulfuromonas sp. DDH964 TaxID=1823759 RepID=UPI00078D172D|nr:tRNA (adenosine(37)-N6)-dimethylallyltransferase MiaA [Desulfuromonas sp. DDH964]AMV71031.1 tRNA delta(2)-isopentenylpyrophosphate transferase [Desulfuromonas sp. DDH964]